MYDLTAETISSRLSNQWLGLHTVVENQVDSTNTRLREIARQGEAHGTVLVADSQTGGRGRRGRKWHSPPGNNLYFSVLLRPTFPPDDLKLLSLVAGVALAEATETFLPDQPTLKWPNDLLWQGRKLAGILVESSMDHQKIHHAIIGIGLNVNQCDFPNSLAQTALSLRQASGHPHNRSELLVQILERLERWLDLLESEGLSYLLSTWQHYAPWMGKQITLHIGNQLISGMALGLTGEGALRLRDNQGKYHEIVAGEVCSRQ